MFQIEPTREQPNRVDSIEVQKKKLHLELDEIKKELNSLFNGTHPVLVEQEQLFELKRKERKWIAEAYRNYRLESIEQAFLTEVQQAEDEWNIEKNQLKDKLFVEIDEQRKKILDDKEIDFVEDISDAKRKLRKRGDDSKASKKKATNISIPMLNLLLSEQELVEDLALILKEESLSNIAARRSTATRNRAALGLQPVEASCYEGQLVVQGQLFPKGSAVSVEIKDPFQKFEGTMNTVNSNEVWVKREDANVLRTRLYFSQIRSGRVTITLLGPPSSQ